MQDGIIKGVGNSRYLKTVADALTLYPTYESFMEALISGTLPIDLNGINADGWTQQGTALNKTNLLKDSTAALFGLGESSVPDDVFLEMTRFRTKIEVGSYEGTGTYGADSPNSITVSFPPVIVVIAGRKRTTSTYAERAFFGSHDTSKIENNVAFLPYLTTNYDDNNKVALGIKPGGSSDNVAKYSKKSQDGKTLYWYLTGGNSSMSPGYQFNESGYTYFYFAIG